MTDADVHAVDAAAEPIAAAPVAVEEAAEVAEVAAAIEEPRVVVTSAPVAVPAPAPTPVSAPVPAPAPAPAPAPVARAVVAAAAAPFVLATDALAQVAESAGLQWVGTDTAKAASVRAAIEAEAKPAHVPRVIKPTVAVDEGPLVLVETQKSLDQIKLPFEHQ